MVISAAKVFIVADETPITLYCNLIRNNVLESVHKSNHHYNMDETFLNGYKMYIRSIAS